MSPHHPAPRGCSRSFAPTWTADKAAGKVAEEGDGVAFFRNAVDYIAETF